MRENQRKTRRRAGELKGGGGDSIEGRAAGDVGIGGVGELPFRMGE